MAACPTNSRRRDRTTGMTVVDQERCIACKTCIAVCPFGACSYDRVTKQIVTCDLCGGDPQCVKVCQPGAVRYVEKGDIHLHRQLEAASKIGGMAGRGLPAKTTRS
jgi:anaerobic carbon-monoxide dehydrogenase iron sulfur subunit